jgi:8-oxo-dGTP pyrophosphatase MutT (NUDIX family)
MPGKWNLPGGGIDKKETPSEAAQREAGEEAGIKIRHLKKVGKFGDGEGGDLHVYHAHGHEGTPKINHESHKLKWVHHSQAHKMDVIPVLKPVLRHFSKEHGSKIKKK